MGGVFWILVKKGLSAEGRLGEKFVGFQLVFLKKKNMSNIGASDKNPLEDGVI